MSNMISLVDERARRIILQHQEQGSIKLRYLCRDLGIVAVEKALRPEHSGQAFFDSARSPSGFFVVVNKAHSQVRKRFTVAHELGHVLLHGDMVRERSLDDMLDLFDRAIEPVFDPILGSWEFDPFQDPDELLRERQADHFASDLLMSHRQIQELRRSGVRTIPALAAALEVSEPALKRQLYELKIFL